MAFTDWLSNGPSKPPESFEEFCVRQQIRFDATIRRRCLSLQIRLTEMADRAEISCEQRGYTHGGASRRQSSDEDDHALI